MHCYPKASQAIKLKRGSNEINAIIDSNGMPHPHDELEEYKSLHQGMESHDDVYGRPLVKESATRARKFEMGFFKKMKVHSKVERATAKQLGAKIYTTRWIDINKDDESKPDYRARLV